MSKGTTAGSVATATATVAIRLRLLHTPSLAAAEGGVQVLDRKDAALLALLAIEGPTPRARAAALLWPDTSEGRARSSLRQRLFRLRKSAGCEVVCAGPMLALAEAVVHDLQAIGPRLAADAEAATGDLLGELDYDDCPDFLEWLVVAREQWRQARRNALAEIAAELEARGRIAPALRYAQRLAADDPTLEHAHRRVMRLHYLRGDRAAALAAYERCRETLREHVGAQPGKETLELARLIEASGALPQAPATAAKPVTVLRPPRLVGRASEWQALGHARVALVSGEPGMGKTRLITDFARAHGDAVVVGSRPGDARIPYALAAPLLRALLQRYGAASAAWINAELAHLLPELGEPTRKFDPLRLQMAIAQALAHWHEAGLRLLAVDDLQFADAATLELLPALASAGAARIVWLFGVRAHEMPEAIRLWLEQQDAGMLAQVALGPLDTPAVCELVESLALPGVDARALAPLIARHTGGSPLFILETLGAMLAQGALCTSRPRLPAPSSIGELIERRLLQLSAPALKLARVAAIAGQDFDAALAAHVLGQHTLDLADAWRELEAAHVIRDGAFAHDLIFEVTLRSVPGPIARVLHADIAAYLEHRHGAAARIAQHWDEAHQPARAAVQYEAAAEAARRASHRSEELALLESAQRCNAQCGQQAAQFDCLQRQFSCALHVGSMHQAEELIARMRPLAQDDRQRALLLVAEARVGNTLAREQAALAAASEASRIAARLADASLVLAASRELAGALSKLDRHDEALHTLQAQRPLLEKVTPGEEVLSFLSDYAYLLCYANRPREGVAEYQRVYEMALSAGDLATAHTVLTDMAVALMPLGELRRSTQAYERARALREPLGEGRGWSLMDDMALAGNYRELGRYREALEMTLAALDSLRAGGFDTWVYQTEHDLAIMYAQLGQIARARKLLSPLPADAALVMRVSRVATIARIERWAGRPARALWDEARAMIEQGGLGRTYVRLSIRLGQLRDATDVDRAARLAELRAEALACEQVTIERSALAFEIEALTRLGATDAAAQRARELVEILRDWEPNGIYPPEAWWIVFGALDAAGAAAEANEAMQRGVDWIRHIALPNVPDELRDGFLNRNPINRAILTGASRRLR